MKTTADVKIATKFCINKIITQKKFNSNVTFFKILQTNRHLMSHVKVIKKNRGHI